jgi:hypothetical protein
MTKKKSNIAPGRTKRKSKMQSKIRCGCNAHIYEIGSGE